jgi:hypothetical protein
LTWSPTARESPIASPDSSAVAAYLPHIRCDAPRFIPASATPRSFPMRAYVAAASPNASSAALNSARLSRQ